MTFSPETIAELRRPAEIDKVNELLNHNGIDAIATPSGVAVVDLEKYRANRRRLTGTMTTACVESFKNYIGQFQSEGDALVFIDPTSMTAACALNFGTVTAPGHVDHWSKLALERTSAYIKLLQVAKQGTRQSQRDAAEFCEDFAAFITFFEVDQTTAIPAATAVKALRNLKIEAAQSATSGAGSFNREKSLLESVKVDTSAGLPHFISFKCAPYKDLEEREFLIRVGVGEDTSKNAVFVMQIVRHDLIVQEMAEELAALLKEKMQAVKVFIGTFAK